MKKINFKKIIKSFLRSIGILRKPKPPVKPVEPPEPPVVEPPIPEPPPPDPIPQLPKIVVDGILFRANGKVWRWKGITGFAAYKRFLDGEDIEPFLVWARDSGANLIRVFGAYTMSDPNPAMWLDPRAYGDRYWEQIPAFLNLCTRHGLYVEWTALCDQGWANWPTLKAPIDTRQAWLRRLSEILPAHTNVLAERMNEPFDNGRLDGILDIPLGVLTASGSYEIPQGSKSLPFAQDFVTFHPDRGDEWPRKAKDFMREVGLTGFDWPDGTHFSPVLKPIVNDEPQRAEENSYAPDFRDHAAVSGMFGAGATFHCTDAKWARIPGPGQQACAKAFFEGLDLVPPDAPLWDYTRGEFSNCPVIPKDELRTYAMLRGDSGIALIVRKNYEGPPPLRDGWRIVRPLTPDFALVEVSR